MIKDSTKSKLLYSFGKNKIQYTSYSLVEIFLIFIFLKITVGITILMSPWKWKEAIHGLIHMLNNIGTAWNMEYLDHRHRWTIVETWIIWIIGNDRWNMDQLDHRYGWTIIETWISLIIGTGGPSWKHESVGSYAQVDHRWNIDQLDHRHRWTIVET